mmetsp:Transcript_59965/g.87839  ORF Transcript_59965/g.87839 Transcript_59965/m.87839 type:complete len:90 (+) Transcript_59965:413-682(+)
MTAPANKVNTQTAAQVVVLTSISGTNRRAETYGQSHTHTRDHHEKWARGGKERQGTLYIKNTITTKVAASHSSQIANFRQSPDCGSDFC